LVLPLRELELADVPRVGAQHALLGMIRKHLASAGIRVPEGFALTVEACRRHLHDARLETAIDGLDRLDPGDREALARTARAIQERIRAAPLPAEVTAAVIAAYQALAPADGAVAVRACGVTERSSDPGPAGARASLLNLRGAGPVIEAVKACMASVFTEPAILGRHAQGIAQRAALASVLVQQLVRSDLASAGRIITLDPASGFRAVVDITAAWGFGGHRSEPDLITIHKPTLAQGFRPIVRRVLGTKLVKLVAGEAGDATREVPVAGADRKRPSLSHDDALTLARWAVTIEEHHARWTGNPAPLELAWAKDGRTGELQLVDARATTVPPRRAAPTYERFRLTGTGPVLATGQSVGVRIAHGRARVIREPGELASFVDGEVLVAEQIDPDWEPVLARAAAVVSDRGGRTGHASIVARELGIPCLVGTGSATREIRTGDEVTVSCAEGVTGHVYAGQVAYHRQLLDPATLPAPPVPVMLNVGEPSGAFAHGQLPSAGVGLARIEFMLSCVGIHPMALVHPERIRDPIIREELAERTAGLAAPTELLVGKLSTGIAQIAAAFHPRPVLVRFSDLKSNEYAGLLGGADFEPAEANPALGFRGASRYYDPRYREGFALECEAILRVRQTMGLTNVQVMIPFCRTLGEARRVLDELADNGLRRGEAGLEVHVMCELPNNVLLAAELSELFDGFSIGSNDLTQFVLGVDRDSSLLMQLFDEQDLGVQRMITQMVETAHRHRRPVGFCGQAPSDDPDYAAFLASLGIDSISVTPDALARVIDLLTRRP
jgi:pyruvate,water dikinase